MLCTWNGRTRPSLEWNPTKERDGGQKESNSEASSQTEKNDCLVLSLLFLEEAFREEISLHFQ